MEEILQRGLKPSVEHTVGLLVCIAAGALTSWWVALIAALVMLAAAQKRSGSAHFDQALEQTPPPSSGFAATAIKPPEKNAFAWPGTGEFLFKLVGQPHFQPALKTLAGDQGRRGQKAEYQATLVLDDANGHDAVRVEIGGVVVGYFGADEARSFRTRLGALGLEGRQTTCAARICCGQGGPQDEQGRYGVSLDLTC